MFQHPPHTPTPAFHTPKIHPHPVHTLTGQSCSCLPLSTPLLSLPWSQRLMAICTKACFEAQVATTSSTCPRCSAMTGPNRCDTMPRLSNTWCSHWGNSAICQPLSRICQLPKPRTYGHTWTKTPTGLRSFFRRRQHRSRLDPP